jgi:hypothetical protein
MRGLKTTLALVVVLGGLLGYIYFVDSKRVIPDPNAKAKAFSEATTADSIDDIEIHSDKGEVTHLQKGSDGWTMTAPEKANADQGVVGTVTTNLGTLEVQRVVEEKAADLKQYGLEPARVEVTFRSKDQKDSRKLLVGDKTATGGDYYAKTADNPRVFLISNYLDSIFNRTAFDLRDKEILKYDREKADAIEVVKGPMTIQFAKTGMEWRVVKPIAVRADFAAVEALLTRLSSTHMQKMVAPEAKDVRMYGLDRPQLTASVTAGSAKASLLLGKMTDDGMLYAKDTSRPPVFTVEQAVITDLGKEPLEYRRKDLFDGRSFTANRLEFKRGTETMIFEKSGPADKEVWKTPEGKTVDTMKVEDLLNKISNLRAESFEAGTNAAIKMPVLTATVKFDQTKMETVTFGKSSNAVFAVRSDEPGTAKVDSAVFEESIKALDALK